MLTEFEHSGKELKTKRVQMASTESFSAETLSSDSNSSSSSRNNNNNDDSNNRDKNKKASSGLPPCRVCGNQGTGFHYGINTCEACKGFFRRSLQRQKAYKCRSDNKLCRIEPDMKSLCPHCRLQKCLKVGMSVEGIKTGRYTLEKKRQDTIEVKRLAQEQAHEKQQKLGFAKQQGSQKLVEAIMTRFWKLFGDVIDTQKALPVMLQEYVSTTQLKNEVFGPMRTVPIREFFETLMTTGLQVDDRLEIMSDWFNLLPALLERKVKFLKSIQGFKGLALGDQIALVKVSWLESWLVDQHGAINIEHRCYAFAFGGISFELDKVLGEDLGESVINVVKRLQALNLTMEESVLLEVFLVFNPDMPGLTDPDKIEAIQVQLLEALLWALEKNHPNDKLIFPRLISAIIAMKTTHSLARETINVYLDTAIQRGYINAPQIFREIIVGT